MRVATADFETDDCVLEAEMVGLLEDCAGYVLKEELQYINMGSASLGPVMHYRDVMEKRYSYDNILFWRQH